MDRQQEEEEAPLLGSSRNDDVDYSDTLPESTGCGGSILCDPKRPVHKYVVLIFMCFLSFGSYFCYDNPAALQEQMKEDMQINTSQFMSFYSLYSWPNVILCFFGGFLIDTVFGIRLGAAVFAGFVTVGQVIFALGALFQQFWLMAAGRFVFGLGGESLCVAQNTYAVSWFKEKELNMVFGLQLSFSRVGSTVNMNIMGPLYTAISHHVQGYRCLGIALMIAVVFCIFSLVCATVLAYFDKRASRILGKDDAQTGEVIRIRDVKNFHGSLWILCIICVTYYVTIFPFVGLGLVFYEMKYGLDPSNADILNSLVYVISAIASPFFGFFVDKTGRNVIWVATGVLLTLACHGLLAFTFLNPYIPTVVMGLAYSVLASALWPLVAIVIPQNQLGTAYGIMQSIQNLGLASVSILAGVLVDQSGYFIYEVFNLGCLCLSLMACVVLYLFDAANGGFLNMSARQRRQLAKDNK